MARRLRSSPSWDRRAQCWSFIALRTGDRTAKRNWSSCKAGSRNYGLKAYTDLTLNKDPGIPIVLTAFVIGLAALLISLYLPLMGPEQRLVPSRELTG